MYLLPPLLPVLPPGSAHRVDAWKVRMGWWWNKLLNLNTASRRGQLIHLRARRGFGGLRKACVCITTWTGELESSKCCL